MSWAARFLGRLFAGPLCAICGDRRVGRPVLGTERCRECDGAYWRETERRREIREREQRIEEQAEALRRAFPKGPYR